MMSRQKMTLKNVKIAQFAKMTEDLKASMEKQKSIKEFKILEESNEGSRNTKTLYFRMKITMMSERDMVYQNVTTKLDDNKILYVGKSVERSDCPVRKGIIRAESYSA